MTSHFHDQVRDAYQAHREGLFGYALALTGSQAAAEDAVQAAFFGLLLAGRMPREPRPYLFRAVRNAAVDCRRLDRQGTRAEETAEDPACVPHPVRDHALREALAALARAEREIIVLKVLAGLTFAEIAEVHGVPLNTAASWYRRGVEKLRSLLEDAP
jgi:RNA polymerase sigma-70 factor (ECF subfamily)